MDVKTDSRLFVAGHRGLVGSALTRALDLPTMQVAGLTMIKRLALIIDNARITHVFYPVFPPDRNAGDVLAWLKENPV